MDKRTEELIKSVLGVKNLDEAQRKAEKEPKDTVHTEAIPEDEIARQFQEDEETIKPFNTTYDYSHGSELLDRELSGDREDDKLSIRLGDDETFIGIDEWKDYVKEICFNVNKSFLAHLHNKKMHIQEDSDNVK